MTGTVEAKQTVCPDGTLVKTHVLWLSNGGALVAGTLLTPEDAVRMLIRCMGQDPDAPAFQSIPQQIVTELAAKRRRPSQNPSEEIWLASRFMEWADG
jgi:hypothetical protein